MTPDTILKDAEERMDKAVEHLRLELRGVRTGRATPSLIEFIKVDYYGTPTDLKALAAISSPEPTQLLIKPFDVGAVAEIRRAIEASDLGFNPNVEDKQIRINIPALSTERRKQIAGHVKKVGEDTKVALRNVRRDANKHADQLKNDASDKTPEDELETLKKEIQNALKKREDQADKLINDKAVEVMQA